MALVGQLGNISLVELLGFFCSQRKTGRLRVDYPDTPGIFYILDGELVDAKLGDLSGLNAIQRASRMPNAAFEFDPNILSTRRTIYEPWTDVEAMDLNNGLSDDTLSDDLTSTYTELLMENSVSDAELLLENFMSQANSATGGQTIDVKPIEASPAPKPVYASSTIKPLSTGEQTHNNQAPIQPKTDTSYQTPIVKPKPAIGHPPLARPIVEHAPSSDIIDTTIDVKPINQPSPVSERPIVNAVTNERPAVTLPPPPPIKKEEPIVVSSPPAEIPRPASLSFNEATQLNKQNSVEESSPSTGGNNSISDKSTGGSKMLRLGRNIADEQNKAETVPNRTAINPTVPQAETPASLRIEQQLNQRPSNGAGETDPFSKKLKDGSLGFVGDVMNFAGEINFRSMLRVDGQFSGHISSQDGSLHVSAGAQVVDVEIRVAEAVINGTVKGNIVATKRIELGRTAVIIGDIQAPSLAIHEGAVLDGCCRMAKQDNHS
jgi:cytoskeletal protein CcmA (bactofilin family)